MIRAIDLGGERIKFGLFIGGLCFVFLLLISRAKINGGPISESTIGAVQPKLPDTKKQSTIEDNRVWLLIGLFIIGLGFAIFGWLPTHEDYTERVYLLSAVGGAIAIPVFIASIGRFLKHERLVTIVGVSVLISIALQGDLVNVLRLRTVSEEEQGFLTQVVNAIPDPGKTKLILFFDPSHQMSTSTMFGTFEAPNNIQKSLRYIYHDDQLDSWVCDPAQLVNDSQNVCVVTSSGVTLTNGMDTFHFLPEETVAFEYTGEDKLKLLTTWPVSGSQAYSVASNASLTSSALHYNGFSRWPFAMESPLPLNEHPVSSVDFDQADVIWFSDHKAFPLVNYGWYGNWTSSTHSSLILWLVPNHNYQIQVVVDPQTPTETLKNITLSVNDTPIPLTAQISNNLTTLTGTIPSAAIPIDKQTQVTFNSSPLIVPAPATTPVDQHMLGFQVDHLTISPSSSNLQ